MRLTEEQLAQNLFTFNITFILIYLVTSGGIMESAWWGALGLGLWTLIDIVQNYKQDKIKEPA